MSLAGGKWQRKDPWGKKIRQEADLPRLLLQLLHEKQMVGKSGNLAFITKKMHNTYRTIVQ